MRIYCHLPASIARPDDLSQEQFDLLQQAVRRAVRRAVSRLEPGDASVEIVPGRQLARSDHLLLLDARAGEMQSDREEAQAVLTVLPVPPVIGAIVVMDGTSAGQATGQGDRLIAEQFPWVPVAERAPESVIYAGGAPYVRTANLVRAMDWGEQLFSDSGFAILQAQTAPAAGDFNVVSLLPSTDGGNGAMLGEAEGNDGSFELLHPEGYATVTVAQSEGGQIFGAAGRDLWDGAFFNEVLTISATEQEQVDQSRMPEEDISTGWPGSESAGKGLPLMPGAMAGSPPVYVDEEMIDLIASMERTVFAAMPPEKRRECMNLMIQACNGEREEQTIIEILFAAQNPSELRMLLAPLSRAGLYEQLFGRLTRGVYELLQQIGAARIEQIIDWQYLVDALLATGIELPEPDARLALAEPQQAAAAFAHLVEQASSALQHIVTTVGVTDDIQGLSLFFWMVQEAQIGNAGAQTLLTSLSGEADTRPAQAIRGLDGIEQLSAPSRQESGESGDALTVRQSLSIASVVVIARQFMQSELARGAMQAGSAFAEQARWLALAMQV